MPNTISFQTTKNRSLQPAIRTIFIACLVAGIFDISYAIITWGPVFGKVTAGQLLRGIASTIMGKDALAGGTSIALIGLAMHFGISLAWTVIYFLIYPYIPFLSRNKWVSGMLYGVVVWALMGMVIVPLVTGRAWHYNTIPVLKNIAPMIILFGPAIAFIVGKHYERVTPPHPE
jgi:hypothetical protein